jgi:hypothetical protein
MVNRVHYNIGLCQKFSQNIHGYTEDSSPEITDHYLCVYLFDYFTPDDLEFALIIADKSHNQYTRCPSHTKRVNRITVEIVETEILSPGGEIVAIYKTFWLRIFQKRVKKWIALKRAVEAVVKNNQISRMLMQREYSGTRMNIKSSVLSNL